MRLKTKNPKAPGALGFGKQFVAQVAKTNFPNGIPKKKPRRKCLTAGASSGH
jgi:hypothetical protein